MTQTTLDLRAYYRNLLIIEYARGLKNRASIETLVAPFLLPQTSIQTVAFSAAPDGGTFTLSYAGDLVAPINWNDSTATIQGKLRALPALAGVTVTGTIPGLTLMVTFDGVLGIAEELALDANSLTLGVDPVGVSIEETDLTLPLAVNAAFNLLGPNTATGKQLDVLGKYAGVSRTSRGFTAMITLGDADFLSLIRMAIIQNASGSSLFDIVGLLNQFFPGEVFVVDHKNMHMSFMISSTVGSQDLIQVYLTEGLLPVPMAVGVTVIYVPVAKKVFGYRTYANPNPNATPFNSYVDYHTDWHWLSYADLVVVPGV